MRICVDKQYFFLFAWTHACVVTPSVQLRSSRKKLQSLAPECSVFLYAGLDSLSAVVVSKELKAYKSHVRVIMYILSASAFTDPQTVCVCVWSLGRATVEFVYSQ